MADAYLFPGCLTIDFLCDVANVQWRGDVYRRHAMHAGLHNNACLGCFASSAGCSCYGRVACILMCGAALTVLGSAGWAPSLTDGCECRICMKLLVPGGNRAFFHAGTLHGGVCSKCAAQVMAKAPLCAPFAISI